MDPAANVVGTVAVIEVSLQLLTIAGISPKVRVLAPWLAPKLVPVTVTSVPTGAADGETAVMFGVGNTVKLEESVLGTPFTVTDTMPVIAPAGTIAMICVSLQLLAVAAVLLNAIVLLPCESPKLLPLIITEAPTGAEAGVSSRMCGVGSTVKLRPLLAALFTVTTTLPVLAVAGTGTTI